uniref:Uncharacterized protein n=1 Tax=Ursus maritimus TaxID=29073 RepID=A0A452TH25_URSMA
MALKFATEKRLENGWRLVEGASLGLFHPNTVEARDRYAGPFCPFACNFLQSAPFPCTPSAIINP